MTLWTPKVRVWEEGETQQGKLGWTENQERRASQKPNELFHKKAMKR